MKGKVKKILWFVLFCFSIFIVVVCFFDDKKNFVTYFYMLLFFILSCVSACKILKKKEMSDEKKKMLAVHLSNNTDIHIQSKKEDVAADAENNEFDTVGVFDSGFEERPVFSICYVDFNGTATKRNIILKSITLKDDKIYLNALCLLRNEDRMFLTDRIKRVEYRNEIIPNPSEYFRNIFLNSGGYALHKFMQTKMDIFKLFMFFIKADNKIAKNEIDIIVEYIKKYLPKISENTAEYSVKNIQVVNIAEFNAIIKKKKKETADNADILEVYKKLYELKKTSDPLEKGIYEKVVSSLQA